MADFLLIHGTGHGAWCWYKVVPALIALGHTARAIDLPSHGDDTTPADQITMARYGQAILDALTGPAIVVGHSMGGFPISMAADRDPTNIQRLVYLCAHIPRPGKSIMDLREVAAVAGMPSAFIPSPDGIVSVVADDQIKPRFYHDCPDEDVALARRKLTPQVLAPQREAVQLGATYDQVPRSYIRCLNDQMISPAYQQNISSGWPSVFDIDTGHSPFFADPAGLAAILDQITQEPST